ncbi:MAG: glycerol-3-phosphate dehydrogenase, partial [Aquamicrobium sp.]|nr:glycerol-3-phosphate dehydrogenase [Aquamicrobium sp.]
WTADAPLPGGEFPAEAFEAEAARLAADYAFLAPGHARRLLRLYGTRARVILGNARSPADLGRHFGADLYEAELRYLIDREWALTVEDVLWRRTKLGLRLGAGETEAVAAFMRSRPGQAA